MDLGFVSMNTPGDLDPAVLGAELESRGFESLWVGEHPQVPVSAKDDFRPELLDAQRRIWDPLMSLMAVAVSTNELRLGTSVALPLEHEIFTFAKQVATLDQMSDGRLLLGVGVGGRAELELSTSIRWPDRYRVLAELVAALKALWTDDESEFHGEFYDFDPVWCHPKPRRSPHPPLLAATTGPRATRECLVWADGWLPGAAAFQDLAEATANYRRMAESGGRDPATLDLTVMGWGAPPLKVLVRYRDLGFNRVVLGGGQQFGGDAPSALAYMDRYAAMIDELGGPKAPGLQ